VQDVKKADPGSQILRIGRDFEQRFGTCATKKIVERFLVLQHERTQIVRKRENYMNIRTASRSSERFASHCSRALV
jgi:hypothetical protein